MGKRRLWLWTASLTLTLTGGIGAVVALGGAGHATVAPTATIRAHRSAATHAPTTEAGFEAAVAKVAGTSSVSVAVEDPSDGRTWSYGDGDFDTASIVKVDVLAALLLQTQDQGRRLTASETSLATAMIERSDDAAATALFDAVGGAAGIEAANTRLGVTGVTIGTDGYWGLTQTTAAGQLTVLDAVFGPGGPLTAASKAYEARLMENVVETQRFGVSAAADDPGNAALKVGFLQRSATGLWDVNSIGRIEVGSKAYLVAVLSGSGSSYDAGVRLIDAVARAAVGALSD